MATGKAVAKSCKHCWGRTQVMWKFVPDLWTLLLHVWFWTLCTVSSKQSSMSEKYFGPKPFSASQANDSVLKSILWCIGSQCMALRTGVLVRTSIDTCKDTITIIKPTTNESMDTFLWVLLRYESFKSCWVRSYTKISDMAWRFKHSRWALTFDPSVFWCTKNNCFSLMLN